MMFGAILGLLSAAGFGVTNVITRRAMLRVSANYIATLTVFTGPIFFLAAAVLTGEIWKLLHFPWQAHAFLALSGIVHFAFGRSWGYRAMRLIGATRSNIVTSLNPIVTVLLAILILGETVSFTMLIGILCTLMSPLVLLKETVSSGGALSRAGEHGKGLDRRTLYKGIFYGIGAALFWGSSAILIKLGLENGGTPVAGTFIAYSSASLVIAPSSFLNREHREEILGGDKTSIKDALYSGLTSNIAQLLRYMALGFGSAIVVSLMLRTMPLWSLLLSFLFMREYESFSRWVLLGNALLVVGAILVVFS
jgi:drug/metabolite transporter (DMT)-like permease